MYSDTESCEFYVENDVKYIKEAKKKKVGRIKGSQKKKFSVIKKKRTNNITMSLGRHCGDISNNSEKLILFRNIQIEFRNIQIISVEED